MVASEPNGWVSHDYSLHEVGVNFVNDKWDNECEALNQAPDTL